MCEKHYYYTQKGGQLRTERMVKLCGDSHNHRPCRQTVDFHHNRDPNHDRVARLGAFLPSPPTSSVGSGYAGDDEGERTKNKHSGSYYPTASNDIEINRRSSQRRRSVVIDDPYRPSTPPTYYSPSPPRRPGVTNEIINTRAPSSSSRHYKSLTEEDFLFKQDAMAKAKLRHQQAISKVMRQNEAIASGPAVPPAPSPYHRGPVSNPPLVDQLADAMNHISHEANQTNGEDNHSNLRQENKGVTTSEASEIYETHEELRIKAQRILKLVKEEARCLCRDHTPARTVNRNVPITEDKDKDIKNVRRVLAITINNHEEKACPDTGSSANIVREDWARDHKLKIRRAPRDRSKLFELGNGKSVRAVGRVCANVEITRAAPSSLKSRKRKVWFYVFEKCPVPIIVGMPFLESEAIFTKNKHLLESCPKHYSDVDSLLWIGSPRNQIRCSLGGQRAVATADTGSDLNIMSLEYAKRRGYWIDDRPEVRRRLQFGDGSIAETMGQVYVDNFILDRRSPATTLENSEDDAVFDDKSRHEDKDDTDVVYPTGDPALVI
ncbi:Peptidase aspartic [Apiospora saccharicola]|uniref:Peptidase aspartic n=1 Tax=Apiospora saccharicola TaxID=335842 RepID=A0ABR1TMC3_9PEZI